MKTEKEILESKYKIYDTHKELNRHSEAWHIREAAEMFGGTLYTENQALEAIKEYHAQFENGQVMDIGLTETPEERATKFEREAAFYRNQNNILKKELRQAKISEHVANCYHYIESVSMADKFMNKLLNNDNTRI